MMINWSLSIQKMDRGVAFPPPILHLRFHVNCYFLMVSNNYFFLHCDLTNFHWGFLFFCDCTMNMENKLVDYGCLNFLILDIHPGCSNLNYYMCVYCLARETHSN